MYKIAVIILNYNSTADCQLCIADLLNQTDVELRIIVVDNSSDSHQAKICERICSEQSITYIRPSDNKGYNAGNNVGLQMASDLGYSYALIANPDMRFPETDYVSKLAEVMQSDPDIAACGSDIVTLEGIHQNPMMADGGWRTSFGWIKEVLKRNKNNTAEAYDFIDNHKESHYCTKLSGCCLMVDLKFLKEIGYFDENVFLYCEEAIFAKQVQRMDKKMYYIASSCATHAHKQDEKGDPKRRIRAWNKSRIYFIKNYSEYPWYGKLLAISSRKLYTFLFNLTH